MSASEHSEEQFERRERRRMDAQERLLETRLAQERDNFPMPLAGLINLPLSPIDELPGDNQNNGLTRK